MVVLKLSCVTLILTLIQSVISENVDLVYYNPIENVSKFTFFNEDINNVVYLGMRACEVKTLANNSFTGMENLQKLYLNHNDISVLPEDVLRTTPSLKEFCIDFNNLTKVPKMLFSQNPKLRIVEMSYNSIADLEPGTFKYNPRIEKIRFSFNKLKIIPVGVFTDSKTLKILDLSGNYIHTIADGALPIRKLDIFHIYINKLRFINETIYGSVDVSVLHDNPWYCDCKIRPLFERYKKYLVQHAYRSPNCAGPKKLYNARWDELSSEDFVCPSVINGTVGQSITLYCYVEGFKEGLQDLIYITYENNTDISRHLQQYNRSFHIKTAANTFGRWYNVTIFEVRRSDEGSYKCVKNKRGDGDEILLRIKDTISPRKVVTEDPNVLNPFASEIPVTQANKVFHFSRLIPAESRERDI